MIFFYSETKNMYYISLAIAALSVAVGVGGSELEPFLPYINSELIMDWSRAVSISFTLSALAMLLWMSKPAFARFPLVFCSLPLLLIFVFPLIIESSALKEMVLSMFQASSIGIGLMLYSLKGLHDSDNFLVAGGITLFLLSFILFWLPTNLAVIPLWIIKFFIASSILIGTHGLAKLIEKEKAKPQKTFL
ncbi:MAG: hypothetical protein WD037_12150 [Balneolales bacterium]